MRNLFLSIVTIAALFAPSVVMAQPIGPLNYVQRANNGNKLIDAQTLAAARSFTLSPAWATMGYGLLVLYIAVTDANDSVTDVTLTCTASLDGGVTDHKLQSCDTASGACTSYNASWSKNPSSSENWTWRVDTEGFEYVECTFTPTGGAAADLITVYGGLAVKGS